MMRTMIPILAINIVFLNPFVEPSARESRNDGRPKITNPYPKSLVEIEDLNGDNEKKIDFEGYVILRVGRFSIDPYLHQDQFYYYQKQRVGRTEISTYVRVNVENNVWIQDVFEYSEQNKEDWIFKLAKAYVRQNLWRNVVPRNVPLSIHMSEEEVSNRVNHYLNHDDGVSGNMASNNSKSAWNPNMVDSLLNPMSAMALQRKTNRLIDNLNHNTREANNALSAYLHPKPSLSRMPRTVNRSTQKGNNSTNSQLPKKPPPIRVPRQLTDVQRRVRQRILRESKCETE